MVKIQRLTDRDLDAALGLVWRVFLAFEAPDYSDEGVREFQRSIHDPQYLSQLTVYGAMCERELLGVIATRNQGTHIALFFVDKPHQRQGVGRRLFSYVCENCPGDTMTVNASPYAGSVYHALGFTATAPEQVTAGLRYTPMACDLRSNAVCRHKH